MFFTFNVEMMINGLKLSGLLKAETA